MIKSTDLSSSVVPYQDNICPALWMAEQLITQVLAALSEHSQGQSLLQPLLLISAQL